PVSGRPTHSLFPYTTLFRSRDRHGHTARGDRLREQRRGAGVQADGGGDGDGSRGHGVLLDLGVASAASRRVHRRRPSGGSGLVVDRKSTRLNSSHVKISYAV